MPTLQILTTTHHPPPVTRRHAHLLRPTAAPRPPQARSLSQTWLEAFAGYAAGECHLAENTVAAYRRNLGRFFQWLGLRSVPELSIRDLADYATWLHAKELAPASIARHIVSLKVFLRYLQLEGVLAENLAELLGSQKLWERVPQVLSPQQVTLLLDSPHVTDPCWRRDRALLELLYATGCRASELSGLRLCDVHRPRDSAPAAARGTKSGSSRWVAGRSPPSKPTWSTSAGGWSPGSSRADGCWCSIEAGGCGAADLGAGEALRRPRGGSAGGQPAHAPPQFRHAHAGRRGRSAAGAGDARPREHLHDPALHPRRREPAEGGAQAIPPPIVGRLPRRAGFQPVVTGFKPVPRKNARRLFPRWKPGRMGSMFRAASGTARELKIEIRVLYRKREESSMTHERSAAGSPTASRRRSFQHQPRRRGRPLGRLVHRPRRPRRGK